MDNEAAVFIIDDDPAVRQSLTVLMRAMGLRAEAYDSAQTFRAGFDASRPGGLLVDVRMPGMSGLALLEQFRREEISLPTIVMSAYGDVPTAVRAMKAGAIDFLEKPCRDQQLWDAIQEALAWDARHRRQTALRSEAVGRLQRLSPGEHDVLRLMTEGRSNKAIAAELKLSVRTIEVRRAKLMKKMMAESLAELIRWTLLADPDYGTTPTPTVALEEAG